MQVSKLRILFFLFTSLIATRAHAGFDALAALADSGAEISAYAVDLQTGAPLAALNADTRLSPASVTKIAVSARILDTWPADKTFFTRLYVTQAPQGGVVNGDVILATEGDTALEYQSLINLAAQFAARGITRITGNVVASTAPFAALSCETEDRCLALRKSSTAYNSPIAGIGVDYGTWCVEVRPTKAKKPAEITSCGGVPLPIAVEGTITTVAAGRRANWWMDRRTVGGEDILAIGGTVAVGELQTEYRSMSDPALGTAQLMRETLRAAGVGVQGSARVRHMRPPVTALEYARIESLPLREQVARMMRFSNNFVADMMTMHTAHARGESTLTLADAAHGLSNYVAVATGQVQNPPLLFSGSGLTPENLISAKEITALLAKEHRNSAKFSAFYSSLVVPRYSASRSMRRGSEDWLDRVAMKTGTLTVPRSVSALGGYLRKRDGGFIAFAIMVNGSAKVRRVPGYKASEAMRADLEALLARY